MERLDERLQELERFMNDALDSPTYRGEHMRHMPVSPLR